MPSEKRKQTKIQLALHKKKMLMMKTILVTEASEAESCLF